MKQKTKSSKGKIEIILFGVLLCLCVMTGNVKAETTCNVSSGNIPEGTPANPVHHCNKEDGTQDTTTWSHVYFGSYPQSEVTDEATKQAIDSAISQGKGQSAGTAESSEGIDVWVGDTKYRRISRTDTNNTNYFDNVSNNGYYYFKWERIKWKVLQNDGNTLFVVADKAIDCKDYNEEWVDVTWETSTIRNWLNTSFYSTAFSSREQSAVVTQNVVNEDNPAYGTEGGNNTSDKIYLLSISEVTNETYGFCSDYSTHSASLWVQPSNYARARGTYTYNDSYSYTGGNDNCWWWLRSPGYFSSSAAYVDFYGWVDRDGITVNTHSYGVCPALHINLSSGIWSMADDGTSGEGGNGNGDREEEASENIPEGTPENPVHHCNKEDGTQDTTTWSYVYFGSYPQSEVTDEAAKQAIDSAISQGKGQSAGTVGSSEGIDVWVGNTKYRKISKEDCNHSSYFDDMKNNGYCYFKWERIKWKVLQNDGSTLFVVADKAVDCKNYNEEYTGITWETSTIRNWLNSSFYSTAFSSSEQSAIVTQNVVNEDNPYYGTEGGNNTSDNIYLLSISEVTNETYGFCSDYGTYSMSRRMKTSDYANARGTWRNNSGDYEGNCCWRLRSPGYSSSDAAHVYDSGYVEWDGPKVLNVDGACPALHINLSSGIWFMVDDGTSGEGGNGNGDREEETLKDLQVSKAKTEYVQGEELNLNDLIVTAVYGNSSKVLPAGSYTTNAATINMNTPGSKTLTISYTEGTITKTAAITITVNPKADTAPKTKTGAKITDKDSAGTYKVTSTDLEAPTVEYTGTTNQKKKTISIPEYVTYQGVKYKVTSVSAKSFKGNKKLTTIKIASSITKIGDSAFEGCTSLKTVTIGKGLKTIGKNAFKNCKKLKTLTIKSTKLKTVGKNAFKGINKKCKIKVPYSKIKAYQKLMKNKGQKATVKITK